MFDRPGKELPQFFDQLRQGLELPQALTLHIRLPIRLRLHILDELFTQCDYLALRQLCASPTKRGPKGSTTCPSKR